MQVKDRESSRLLQGQQSYYSDQDYEEAISHNEADSGSCLGGFLKAIVFGGLDGLLTAFSLVGGAIGGGLSWRIIIIIGISNIFADSIAMGAGEYLSSKAHREYVLSEKRREKWQYKNNKETEVREMIRLFVRKGMPAVDAELVVKKMAEYEDFFVDLVVTQELGLQLSDEDEFGLIQDSAIMFLSFALCGAIPLFPFLLGPFDIISDTNMSYLSCGISVICLFLLGALKSSFSSSTYWLCTGAESVVLGSTCVAFAYAAGAMVQELLI